MGREGGPEGRNGASNFSLGPRPCNKQIVHRAAKHAEVPFRRAVTEAPFRRISYVHETTGGSNYGSPQDRWGGRRKRKEERQPDRNSSVNGQTRRTRRRNEKENSRVNAIELDFQS